MQIRKARGLNKKMVNPQPEQRKHLREFCHVLEAQGSVPIGEWLLEVRDGKFSYDEILAITEERLIAIREAFEKSALPEEPDREKICDLLREVQVGFA